MWKKFKSDWDQLILPYVKTVVNDSAKSKDNKILITYFNSLAEKYDVLVDFIQNIRKNLTKFYEPIKDVNKEHYDTIGEEINHPDLKTSNRKGDNIFINKYKEDLNGLRKSIDKFSAILPKTRDAKKLLLALTDTLISMANRIQQDYKTYGYLLLNIKNNLSKKGTLNIFLKQIGKADFSTDRASQLKIYTTRIIEIK